MFNHIGENWRAYGILAISTALLGFAAEHGLMAWHDMSYSEDQSKIAMLGGEEASEAALNATNAAREAKEQIKTALEFGVPGVLASIIAVSSISKKVGAKKK